jgi:IS30 family transposase
MNPDDPALHVSHETIYCAIYAVPRGELRSELIAQLRFAHKARMPRARGQDRRGTLPNMTSIHQRPIEVAARLVPGHWEGDHIKGPGNRSSVGTLVERKSRYLMLVKLRDGSAEATLEGFTRKFRHVPLAMKKSLTYDQGRRWPATRFSPSASRSTSILPIRTALAAADQREYQRLDPRVSSQGLDLAPISQGYLNAIARQLNNRPRKCLDFETPRGLCEEIMNFQPGVALQT